jgi:hypothetical protein
MLFISSFKARLLKNRHAIHVVSGIKEAVRNPDALI